MLRLTFAWMCSNAYAFDCNLSIKNMLVLLTQFLVKVTFTLHYQQATNSILLNILKFLHFLLKEDLNVHHITRAFKQLLISASITLILPQFLFTSNMQMAADSFL